jgi:molybdate transport system substrate-binding protein
MRRIIFLLALVALFIPSLALADEFNVAVASNFTDPAKDIAAEFEKDTGHKAILSFGSTGSFASQIQSGSPVDIFLAADTKTPLQLEELEGDLTVKGSRFTYAQGALALWSLTEGYVDSEGQVLKTGDYLHLAIADAQLAPYGLAAEQFLTSWKLLDDLKSAEKLVIGQNIGQTVSFVQTGAAELGLVALSQVWKNGSFTSGSGWIVPADLYSPILQDVVILSKAADNQAVQAFAAYLRSGKAKDIIRSYGYTLP